LEENPAFKKTVSTGASYRNTLGVRKKRYQIIFCNIFYKTWAVLMKFGTRFPE